MTAAYHVYTVQQMNLQVLYGPIVQKFSIGFDDAQRVLCS